MKNKIQLATKQKSFIATAALALLCGGAFAQSSENEIPHYAFVTGELTTSYKDAVRTVTGSDGKKLLLADTINRLAFNKNVAFQFIPYVALTDDFAEVSDADLGFASLATSRREAKIASDSAAIEETAAMESARLENEAQIAAANGDTDAAEEYKAEAADVTQEATDITEQIQSMIDEGALEKEGVFDIFFAKFTVTPHQNLKDAFAALVLSFDETDPLLKRQGVKQSLVSVTPLGTIQADQSVKIKVSKDFMERKVTGATVEIYIFSGDGQPVATNQSNSLKRLSADQLERWRQLEASLGGS